MAQAVKGLDTGVAASPQSVASYEKPPGVLGGGSVGPGVRPGALLPPGGGMHPQPGILHLPPGQAAAVENGQCLSNVADGGAFKDKTPMCLVNELARYNKIQHQYTLTDEQGPAHKKIFFVKLKLGEEEYSSSGPSIKKAQHSAADMALADTKYAHPSPKPKRTLGAEGVDYTSMTVTPTVELNTLAMKRGEATEYRPIEPVRPVYPPPSLDFRGMYNQRYHYPRCPRMFCVSLKVGNREFIGEGITRQAARHNAAAKALKVLKHLPLPAVEAGESSAGEQDQDGLKSEISLVHELALKRNLAVTFEVVKESGPPHMRTFVTRCTVGDLNTEGEGNGKKLSKKRAAEKMLQEMNTLPPLPASVTVNKPVKRAQGNKKKNRNLIKVQKGMVEYGVGINPISRLIQIQQAKREKEPTYILLDERGLPRKREFVIQVQVGEQVTQGVGPSKKLAKRNGAEAMLQLLGYSRPSPQPSKPAIKSGESQNAGDKKVTFMDSIAEASALPARQLVPGILLMPDTARGNFGVNSYSNMAMQGNSNAAVQDKTTALIAKELLDTGTSPTAENIRKSGTTVPASKSTVRPKAQLLYLADVLGFTAQFTDIPKMSDGTGVSIEEAHDDASLKALRALSELGLEPTEGSGGDSVVKLEPASSEANASVTVET